MRVIGGSCRGRKLNSPKGRDVRPTADKVREAIFDMAFGHVEGARVLDLYAGTGAMGIEALSRGAEFALFVERDNRNAALVVANLERCGLSDRGRIMVGDVVRVLEGLPSEPKWDLVFADPPYAVDAGPILHAVAGCGAVAAGATLFLERGAACVINKIPDGLSPVKEKRYGDTSITIYSKRGERA